MKMRIWVKGKGMIIFEQNEAVLKAAD